jgi:hypothetical protein
MAVRVNRASFSPYLRSLLFYLTFKFPRRRINPNSSQRERLLMANANRCCVCKRCGVGLHLHHIDQDSSNTVDENLAILCVEDHDRHHRPGAYQPSVNHLELSPEEIRKHKRSWEAFVSETRKPFPRVIATLAAYGAMKCFIPCNW